MFVADPDGRFLKEIQRIIVVSAGMWNSALISVVIPALDEDASIVATLESVSLALKELNAVNCEVIVIDDGCSDSTAEKALAHGARVIRHACRIGYGRSLKDGIMSANNDTVVIIDADGTYPAAAIPALLSEYEGGLDMVVGARSGSAYHSSILKDVLRRLLRLLVHFLTGADVPDVNSGLRVFSRASVLSFADQLCDTFSFTTSLTVIYILTGRRVKYVPITYSKRTAGESRVRLLPDSLITLKYVLQLAAFYKALNKRSPQPAQQSNNP